MRYFDKEKKSKFFWFYLSISIYMYSILNSYNDVGDLCIKLPTWHYEETPCLTEEPILFLFYSFVWVSGSLFVFFRK